VLIEITIKAKRNYEGIFLTTTVINGFSLFFLDVKTTSGNRINQE